MSLEKAKAICKTVVDVYGNNAIDIQGGEPTIYRDIYELVAYCREIGLLPTLITNALVLANRNACIRLKEAGVRDLLVSVHGLGETFDNIVGVKEAHKKQMDALDNLVAEDIPFRFNCVLSKMALPQLVEIAQYAVSKGARVVNFIAFNPFEDQQKQGKRCSDNVPRYSEVSEPLTKALDLLASADVEANVRYFPFCMLDKRHWKSNYNLQQLPYDIHEWDFASWSWSGRKSQRMRDGDVSPVVSLDHATYGSFTYPGPLQSIAVKTHDLLSSYPRILASAEKLNRRIGMLFRKSADNNMSDSEKRENLYRANARMRAEVDCKYVFSEQCRKCSLRGICDGFHGDYADLFGISEAESIQLSETIGDPKQFISLQSKVIEPEDYAWAL